MSAKKDCWEFDVAGVYPFPIDMLRYDCCYPKTSDDAVLVAVALDRRSSRQRRVIRLVSKVHPPTQGRWLSFGWECSGPGTLVAEP